jgi:hypothetical protein
VNDQSVSNFVVFTGNPLPVQEGFESATFPPVNWYNNSAPSLYVRRTALSGGFGNSTASMEAWNYSYTNATADFSSREINTIGVTAPASLTFSLAYAARTDTSADTLQVYISTDCGNTFQLAYSKTGAALKTTTNHTTIYTAAAADWRTETIDLTPYINNEHLMVKFHFRSGDTNHRGNNLFVDDINIIGFVGINELALDNAIHIYPNPAHGSFALYIDGAASLWDYELSIYDAFGKMVYSERRNVNYTKFDSRFAPGVYFLKISEGKRTVTKKLVIE